MTDAEVPSELETRGHHAVRLPRTYLYVTGDRPDMLGRAGERGADAIIADLEDSATPSRKAMARRATAAAINGSPSSTSWWVRVNHSTLEEDLGSVFLPGLAGVVLPKVTRGSLNEVDQLLGRLGAGRANVPGELRVLGLVESAAGLVELTEIARHRRIVRLGIGEADLAGELGIRLGSDRAEMWPIRLQVVIASAAAGLAPPVGPVETNLNSGTHTAESTRVLLQQGFRARTALHPDQIAVINQIFTPSAEELEEAREVIRRLESVGESGVAVLDSGQFVDAAVARAAREVIARAAQN